MEAVANKTGCVGTCKKEPLVLSLETLYEASKGDKKAVDKVLYAVQSAVELVVKQRTRKNTQIGHDSEEIVQEILLKLHEKKYQPLIDYAVREKEGGINHKMLVGVANRLYQEGRQLYIAKRFQVNRNVLNNANLIRRCSTIEQIETAEENAWLLAKITGLSIVVVQQTIKQWKQSDCFRISTLPYSPAETPKKGEK